MNDKSIHNYSEELFEIVIVPEVFYIMTARPELWNDEWLLNLRQ
jgi:hypothetical protein